MKEKILFAVMDWGIGHATRSVPVIRNLQKEYDVILASAGPAYHFLKSYFPESVVLEKPGYNIQYSKTLPAFLSVIGQFRQIFSSLKKEKKWCDNVVAENEISKIYSDNCYGCYHQNVESIIITHQLIVKSPFGERAADHISASMMRKFLSPFDRILVPDNTPPNNLSGRLSDVKIPGKRIEFIGIQSRFSGMKDIAPIENDVCIMLSGPEPQRTILEKKLLNLHKDSAKKIILIRGLPAEKNPLQASENITVFNHPDDQSLAACLKGSKEIICRSGYSTIMDLVALGLKATLIPTPGQTEQEYLAERMLEGFGFGLMRQSLL